ncbi:MAG: extracellular solute-binding protein, partial [Spirochaetota bacterium]
MTKIIDLLKRYFGFIIIVGAFLVSALAVYLNQQTLETDRTYTVKPGDTLVSIASNFQTTAAHLCDENYPDINEREVLSTGMVIRLPQSARSRIITVRIAHWQLEPGFRDGIDELAKEYRKIHPNVRVVQVGVPYSTYGQWFVTQMVGGAPPDLIQIGFVPYNLLISYYLRYFTPLTDHVTSPNPYNANNEFAGVALRETTKDGLKAGYVPDIQEYMNIGITMHLTRMYYNKSLLKKLTGRTAPPSTFGEFIRVCEEIKRHTFVPGDRTNAPGTPYVPIANSDFHMKSIMERNFFDPITTKARDIIDFNHDCTVSTVEQYIGMKTGLISLDHPGYRAKFAMVSAVASNSVRGFIGLNRDDGIFMFIQQRAVFVPGWTADAPMVVEQGKDNGFEVGVFDYPFPGPADKGLYENFAGPGFEDVASGTQFGCATPEKDPERRRAAIDFLLFVMQKENNIALNAKVGWIPCVKGAPGTGVNAEVSPHADGVTPGINFNIGGESIIKWQQVYAM